MYECDHQPTRAVRALVPWLLMFVAGYLIFTSWSRQKEHQPRRADHKVPLRPTGPPGAVLAQRGAATVRRVVAPGEKADPRPISPRGKLQQDEQQTVRLFRNSSDSVVNIKATEKAINRFTMSEIEIPHGTGTGFVWDDQGHIVTNHHVIASADKAKIILADQTSYMAKLAGTEPDKDIAVLKIEAPPEVLRALPIGTSEDLEVGQNVYAIGNPFGLDQTLTTGIISGLGREIKSKNGRRITGMIQTDAAINPGNSGGPLLDSSGRLIGVNTAIYSPSGAYAGIGFAIPVDIVNRIVPQLIKFGRVIDKPRLGIVPNVAVVRRMRMKGILVVDVVEGGTADGLGMKPSRWKDGKPIFGDIIVGIGDQAIGSVDELLDALDQYEIGDQAEITVVRGALTDDPRKVTLRGELKGPVVVE